VKILSSFLKFFFKDIQLPIQRNLHGIRPMSQIQRVFSLTVL